MRADDHAETGDGDPAHLRIRLFDLIAHIGGVIPAVGLQDPKLKTRGVNFAQVMQNAVYNGALKKLNALVQERERSEQKKK